MQTVEDHLEDIAIAGYSTIQISPMQPQKDYFGAASWGSSWWKLYQPLGFVIAESDHTIGTLRELESLCASADEYGIKIIVDVVANHLAGGTNESLNEDVLGFEPEIYNQNLIHTGVGQVSDTSLINVTKGFLGDYPDLQTENQVVQDAVLDLLKDYVDAGIDGFRFDAAKHIETPEDGEYASDFWPTVINGVTEYAALADVDLYFYGEILNTVGSSRSYADYTQYMKITDSNFSDKVRNAILAKDGSRLEHITNLAPEKVVLWAESHDNYASEYSNTQHISQEAIGTLTIGSGDNVETTFSLSDQLSSGGYLVPARQVDNSNKGAVGSIDLSFDVQWLEDEATSQLAGTNSVGQIEVSHVVVITVDGKVLDSEEFANIYKLINVAYNENNATEITLDAEAITFNFELTMDEPADQEEYNLIANAEVSITFTYNIDDDAIVTSDVA